MFFQKTAKKNSGITATISGDNSGLIGRSPAQSPARFPPPSTRRDSDGAHPTGFQEQNGNKLITGRRHPEFGRVRGNINHRISGAFFVINIKSKRLRVLIRFRRELTAPEPAVRSFLTNTTNDLAASCAFGGAEGAS
jgi:hypothetical protein